MVFIQVFIRKNRINTASTWSLYRSGHANLAINKKMADDITDTVSTVPKMPEIIFKLVYGYSQLCIMKCVFWYLSYIMSSYKHWNVECVGDNHPLIVLNKIGCIFTLVYGYRKYHEMGVLIFILHYFLVQTLKCGMCPRRPPLHIAFIGCILHISVLVNIGCFDIGCILHIGVLVNKGIMKWVLLH